MDDEKEEGKNSKGDDEEDAEKQEEKHNNSNGTHEQLNDISPSPALQIEGVVQGEPDNGGVQSEGSSFLADDGADEVYNYFNYFNFYILLKFLMNL